MKKIDFLKRVEGNKYSPYVPENDKSGVTIGIGVDLGNVGIQNLDIPESLRDKVSPFDGLKGDDAREAINRIPLNLSREEVNMLSMAAIEQHEKELKIMYGPSYADLSPEKQSVLLSVKYQYGNLPERTPDFWEYVTNDDWQSAYYELMNFRDDYPSRRETEAKLIEPQVYAGGLPAPIYSTRNFSDSGLVYKENSSNYGVGGTLPILSGMLDNTITEEEINKIRRGLLEESAIDYHGYRWN